MMRNEFEQLTGIYPSTELYRAIEMEENVSQDDYYQIVEEVKTYEEAEEV